MLWGSLPRHRPPTPLKWRHAITIDGRTATASDSLFLFIKSIISASWFRIFLPSGYRHHETFTGKRRKPQKAEARPRGRGRVLTARVGPTGMRVVRRPRRGKLTPPRFGRAEHSGASDRCRRNIQHRNERIHDQKKTLM